MMNNRDPNMFYENQSFFFDQSKQESFEGEKEYSNEKIKIAQYQ